MRVGLGGRRNGCWANALSTRNIQGCQQRDADRRHPPREASNILASTAGSDPLSGSNTESLWCSQQAYSFLTDQVICGDKPNASKMYLQGRFT